jgi:hypothetical protein
VQKILLIEPNYKNKYPPLGLMKISTFHKQKGDNVYFFKGCSPILRKEIWDRVYISTLFTFYWNQTINTINYYRNSVRDISQIYVGGVMATLMKEEIKKIIDVTVIEGLLNKKGILGYEDDHLIDDIFPDYSIIDQNINKILNYSYPTNDSYIAYATRGCIRRCEFCAVPIIEPCFQNSKSIAQQVNAIKNNHGEKRDLLLLDNNILASKEFPKIIEEIKSLGFEKGSKLHRKKGERKQFVVRHVDFNQGLDARLLTPEKMSLLAELCIDPMRIAFDDIKLKSIYLEKQRLAAKCGIKTLSNYILYNFTDTPEDFYARLLINIELNEEFKMLGLKSEIWSFPMKYSPIFGEFSKNRKFVGKNWNKKYLRGIQCILLSTRGVVGPKRQFFEKAFGENVKEFLEILTLPEKYIIYRDFYITNGDRRNLEIQISSLSSEQRSNLMNWIYAGQYNDPTPLMLDNQLKNILKLYKAHS